MGLNSRYLLDFNTDNMYGEYYDVIIIGSGIAGVYTALEIDSKYSVAILTKDTIDISNSVLAQGGIAVSLGKEDSPESHLKDTLYAGAGLCNEESVRVLVNNAADNIKRVCSYGVQFDRVSDKELALTREAAHSKNRIIHAGDSTGREVLDKLIVEVNKKINVYIKERTWVVDLLTEGNTAKGLIVYDEDSREYKVYYSNVIICASGGYGHLYRDTTNPAVSTGDGAAMAYRAGACLMDLEFVQFHPTVLYHPENKNFLISEAVRGEGARLLNDKGERFMENYHELKELAPRDVVSRAIFKEMQKNNIRNVYLDITFKDRDWLEKRFPMIFRTCMSYGIDMSKDYIPVAPSQHYCMGGIKTDIYGRTTIKGFYVCGESACNGIHGANRLASNSLLEGLVFGKRISQEVDEVINETGGKEKFVRPSIKSEEPDRIVRPNIKFNRAQAKEDIRTIMTENVGIIRDRKGLSEARAKIAKYEKIVENMLNDSIEDVELQNTVLLAKLITESAIEREESRGAHYRTDFPETDDEEWKRNIIKRK